MPLVTTTQRPSRVRSAVRPLTLAVSLLLAVVGLVVLGSGSAVAEPGAPGTTSGVPARGAASPHGVDAVMAVVSEHGLTALEVAGLVAAAVLVLPCLVYLALGAVGSRRRA